MATSIPTFAGQIPVARASTDERVAFLRRTYAHLGGAILLFVALEALLLRADFTAGLVARMIGGRMSWILILGLFMAVGWVAERWAASGRSQAMQYAGLALYVVAEAFLFLPLLYIASLYAGPEVIPNAGLITGVVFAGLSGTVLLTKKDFSWMRQGLVIAGFAALGLIIASALFGFSLGTLFSVAMVVLAAGYILYYTSQILHHYPATAHVAAALALFASIALLFWYVLRILMDRRR